MKQAKVQLRDYQASAVVEMVEPSDRLVLIVLGTGGGKSFIACMGARILVEQGHRVLIVVPFLSLIDQFRRSLIGSGFEPHEIGLIWANKTTPDIQMPGKSVVIAMQDSLKSRGSALEAFNPTVAIQDEWHLSGFAEAASIYGHLPKIGFTATPWRLDGGVDLSSYRVIQPRTADQLILQGSLLDYTIESFEENAVLEISAKAGKDLTQQQQSDITNSLDKGFVFDEWYTRAWDAASGTFIPTAGFVPNKATAEEYCRYWCDRGIPATFITDSTPVLGKPPEDDEFGLDEIDGVLIPRTREHSFRALRQGKIKVIFAVLTLAIGFDEPCVGIVLGLRSTNSLALLLQMEGRALRPFPGNEWLPAQTHAIILDFVKNHSRMQNPLLHSALITDWRYLDDCGGISCAKCKGLSPKTRSLCMHCGEPFPVKASGDFVDLSEVPRQSGVNNVADEILDGRLVPVKGLGQTSSATTPEGAFRKMVRDAYIKGHKPTSAAYRFMERHPGEPVPPMNCLVGAVFGDNPTPENFNDYFARLVSLFGDLPKDRVAGIAKDWLIAEFGREACISFSR